MKVLHYSLSSGSTDLLSVSGYSRPKNLALLVSLVSNLIDTLG